MWRNVFGSKAHVPPGERYGSYGWSVRMTYPVQFTSQLPGCTDFVAPEANTSRVSPASSTTSTKWSITTSLSPSAIVVFSASDSTPEKVVRGGGGTARCRSPRYHPATSASFVPSKRSAVRLRSTLTGVPLHHRRAPCREGATPSLRKNVPPPGDHVHLAAGVPGDERVSGVHRGLAAADDPHRRITLTAISPAARRNDRETPNAHARWRSRADHSA